MFASPEQIRRKLKEGEQAERWTVRDIQGNVVAVIWIYRPSPS